MIKKFFKYLYSHKYHILIFALSFVLFFIILLPEKRIINAGLKSIEQETGVKIELIEPNLKFFPNFGINSKKVFLRVKDKELKLGETSLNIPWFPLILMQPDIELNTRSFQGIINLKIFGFTFKERLQFLDIDLKTKNINIFSFKEFMPNDLEMLGFLDLYLTGIINLDNFLFSDVSVTVKTKKLLIKETKFMGIDIPSIDIDTSDFFASLSKTNLVIRKLILGDKTKDINLDLKGTYSLKGNGDYSFFVDLKLKDEFEEEYGSFLSFIKSSKKQDGTYKFKAKGNMRAPIPMITPIK
jgi:type II secretion system protein N